VLITITKPNDNPKEKESKSVYTAPQSAHTWIIQFYLQITPRLPFLPKRSSDVADIQLQLTTHLSIQKG